MLFLAFAAEPGAFGPDRPPAAVRAILLLSGGALVGMGVLSCLWVWRRSRALCDSQPESGNARLHISEDSDSTSYEFVLHLEDGAWTVGATGAALRGLKDGETMPCRVWRHAPGGPPIALEIGGRQVNTLPQPRRAEGPPHGEA
jgi:hypothetical protein